MKKNSGLAKTIVSILVAFVLFFGFLAVGFSLSDRALNKSKNGFIPDEWEFIWGLSSEEIEGSHTTWNLSSDGQAIRKPAEWLFKTAYIRMSTMLPAGESEKVLEIFTLGNPLKVELNGAEIFNNQYKSALYTGNRVNIVPIPKLVEDASLELYMAVPFAFVFSARVTEPGSSITAETLINLSGFIAGAAFLCTGVMLGAALVFLSLKYKGVGASLWLFITMVVGGAGLVLKELSLHTGAFSDPIVFKLQIISLFILSAGIFGTAISVAGWHGFEGAIEVLNVILALILCAFAATGFDAGIKIVLFLPVVLLLTCIAAVIRLWEGIRGERPLAFAASTAFFTCNFCLIFDSVFLFAGWGGRLLELKYFGVALFSVVMVVVMIKDTLYTNIAQEERELQSKLNNIWTQKAISSCAGVFLQQNIRDFYKEIAGAIKELVIFDSVIGSCQPADFNIKICVGVDENGEFRDCYTENSPEFCSYQRILERAKNTRGNNLLVTDHTLDVIFYLNGRAACIIHVEGIPKKPSPNLINTLNSAYNGISEALNNHELKEDIAELQEKFFINLAEMAENRQCGTSEHLKIVSEMVYELCGQLGMNEHEKRLVSLASMVHDIGKLAIPDSILSKKGKLTEDEFAIMQDHVIYGYNIMSKGPGEFLAAAAVIAQQHHEKYDGTGYIELKGEEIHPYARIVAVADVFEALLSERPYKDAWDEEEACRYIESRSGTHFDPKVVEAFVNCKDKLTAIKRRYAGEAAYV